MDKKGGWGLWLRSFVQQEHVSRRKIIWLILATGFSRLSINISNQDNTLRSIEPDNMVRQLLYLLEKELRKQDYLVLSLSFEAADEVDKSSDNQIFLSFLGLLREKYLKCQQGKDVTFHSVILAGVYDIKTLKLKLHPQEESKYNSPWNIADNNQMYMKVSSDRNQFIVSGMLQMPLVMQKFYEYYEEIYSEKDQKFIEENGRKLFLLFLKPIINGTGNYYIEARTRDNKRTDIIIDYKGKQFVIELKIWRGNEYNQRARQQIFEYLDYYQKEEGYLLSFNFNKNKETGIKKIEYKGKHIIETVV